MGLRLAFFFFLSLWFLFAPAFAQIPVAATTPILADLVREVGGSRVRVVGVVPPGGDPHTFKPTPSTATLRYAERIAQELTRLDPKGKEFYQNNLARFRKEVERRDQAFHTTPA